MTFDERHRAGCGKDACGYCAMPSEAPPSPRPEPRMGGGGSRIFMAGLVVEMEVDGKRYVFVDERLFQLVPWLFCVFLGMGFCSFMYVVMMSWQSVVG